MAEQKNYSSLSERVGILVANLISLYIPFVWASGLLLPSGGLESTWIISAFALWLLNMLSAPWFVPPRDTLSNAITAAAILVTMDLSAVHQFGAQLDVVRWVATAYCVTAIIVSVVALVLHDRDARSIHGRLWYRISALLGRGEILYTPPALISILGAYQNRLSDNCMATPLVGAFHCRQAY